MEMISRSKARALFGYSHGKNDSRIDYKVQKTGMHSKTRYLIRGATTTDKIAKAPPCRDQHTQADNEGYPARGHDDKRTGIERHTNQLAQALCNSPVPCLYNGDPFDFFTEKTTASNTITPTHTHTVHGCEPEHPGMSRSKRTDEHTSHARSQSSPTEHTSVRK